MNTRNKYLFSLVVVIAIAIGALVFRPPTPSAEPIQESAIDDSGGNGLLDGLSFTSELGLVGKAADVQDDLVFANGKFVSKECEQRCSYPASPYYVRQVGEAIEFISHTKCPYKDASIVWRGKVENGAIEGVSTWTSSRWYWTIEKNFYFRGTLANKGTAVSGSN